MSAELQEAVKIAGDSRGCIHNPLRLGGDIADQTPDDNLDKLHSNQHNDDANDT